MAILGKDPLITVLHAIMAFFMGIFAFVMLLLAIGFIAVPFFQADIAAELAAEAKNVGAWQGILIIEGLLLGIFVLLGLVEYFFLLLWRVLASVKLGDPFTPLNSTRLNRMAWTAVAGNVWAVLLGVYATWMETLVADEINDADLNFDSGTGGLILILVLFVLARVFRQGTEMREELEGTV